ncbi:MAG TPA: M14 family metallopeptidase [Bacteroidales bacterium]|nr:M14 family metallopeptidase [Bacteroidales bacterium]
MKRTFLFAGTFLISLSIVSQTTTKGQVQSEKLIPENKIYTVAGERHGISFFPKVNLNYVQYTPGDTLSFNQYHSEQVMVHWLKKWADQYPDLIDLYVVGESFEGRPVYQITLTNKKTGKDTEKPGAFFEGNRHSGEITSAESVMWLIKYLVENYGRNPEITHLIDTKAIYLKPVNNPDGQNLYLHTAQSNRSTVRPEDNDNDGLLDEDAPDDLDSNGVILNMRWKDPVKGSWIPDTLDPTGRIMKRVGEGIGIYSVASEGIDNDGDGRINEDGIGGLDLHRNYPENWRPQNELTGRGFTQGGAGEYPLSETETRAVVLFLLTHPNIYVVNSMDTSVPMHLRPPSTSASEDRMYPDDLKWYKIFDEIGEKITGYEKAGDVYNDYSDGAGNPLFGHGPDFGYFYYGAIWYGDELWNTGKNKDYNGDGEIDQVEMLRWDDEENDSLGFYEWIKVKHPVYGEVEVGGFDPKFFLQNPPVKFLEKWAKNEALFNIELMKHLPELEWGNIEVQKIKSYKSDSADYRVKVSYRNTGKLPTALSQAYLVKIVKEDRVVLDFDTTGTGNHKFIKIIEKEKPARQSRRNYQGMGYGSDPRVTTASKNMPFTQGGSFTTAVFSIRVYGQQELSGKANVISTRGGVLRDKDFNIR